MDLNKYTRGIISIEIQSLMPEKFINLLWKNNVHIKNIMKINITTMKMDVNLKDYNKIEDIAKKSGTRIKIVGRKGISFFLLRLRKNFTLLGGVLIFAAGLYYLSTYIWSIEITADKHLSPYEIRRMLYSYGIRPGIPKERINVYALEDRMKKDNDYILWNRIRIEGSTLKVNVLERFTTPDIVSDNSPCDIVSKMDGEIISIYTTAGTAVVKPGEVVKNGQLLVKGLQGKDGSTYQVHAQGEIQAKTFYEHFREVEIKGTKVERTGNISESKYVEIGGKKLYLKKSLNKFESCDKIENKKGFVKQEIFYETTKKEFSLDKSKVEKDIVDELLNITMYNLDKSAKVLDKKVDAEVVNNTLKIRVVFIVQQNIGVQVKNQ